MDKKHTTAGEPNTTDDLTKRDFEEITDAISLDDEDIDVVDDEEAVETARIKAELEEQDKAKG